MSSKRTVVVVDDCQFDLECLCDLVEEAGGTVVAACSTLTEAQAALQEHRPALLLTDYCLGKNYGTELAEEWGGPLIIVSAGMTPRFGTIIEKIAQAVAFDKGERADILAAIRERLGPEEL